jgi:hypothetical protein
MGISSKIRLDAMSKIVSFSISDRYLEKIRSIYPDMSDNLAAKQFLTDRLDEGLSSSLDARLDDGLDDRVKILEESELDVLLDVRLDATVGKLIGDLSERLSRLESRLDDTLDANLDATMLDDNLDQKDMTTTLQIGYSDQELAQHLSINVASIKRWKSHIKKGRFSRPHSCPDFFENWQLNEDNLWESKE